MPLEKLNSHKSDWLPSLNALRALEVVARRGSFQAAADELSVTPAAVHQLVRSLESTLDKKLILRRGRNLTPTPEAEEGLGELHQAFDLIARAVRALRMNSSRQPLRVSTEPSFAAAWLVGRLWRFHEYHPDIEVLIDASFAVADLNQQEADIAIRYSNANSADLVTVLLFEDETIPVCAPRVESADGTKLSLESLSNHTFIHFEWPHQKRIEPTWSDWLDAVGRKDVSPRRVLRFTDYSMALQAVIGGQGIGLVSRPLVEDALDAGLLTIPFEQSLRNDYAYYVVATQTASERSDVRAFIDWICAEANAQRASP
jgi:LysR family glycine cleavage system transcriptional activator